MYNKSKCREKKCGKMSNREGRQEIREVSFLNSGRQVLSNGVQDNVGVIVAIHGGSWKEKEERT